MSTQAPVSKDDPLMIEWEKFKASGDYANAINWATYPSASIEMSEGGTGEVGITLHYDHIVGSMWAVFYAGYNARAIPLPEDVAGLLKRTKRALSEATQEHGAFSVQFVTTLYSALETLSRERAQAEPKGYYSLEDHRQAFESVWAQHPSVADKATAFRWFLEGREYEEDNLAPIERAKENDAEAALRSLASWLGNGGYNAPTVDAAEFERKIRDGVETMIRVETKRAEQRIERKFLAEPRISDDEMMSLLRRVNKEFETEVGELSRERAVLVEGLNAALRFGHNPDRKVEIEYAEELQRDIDADKAAVRKALVLIEGEKGEG